MAQFRKTNTHLFLPRVPDSPYFGAKPLFEWSEISGVKPQLILYRLQAACRQRGVEQFSDLPPDELRKAIFTEPRQYRKRAKEGSDAIRKSN
jgi:hypothetical protein